MTAREIANAYIELDHSDKHAEEILHVVDAEGQHDAVFDALLDMAVDTEFDEDED